MYAYAAVCPETGESAALLLPEANAEAMKLFLGELSRQAGPERHVVLVLDGAGYHRSEGLLEGIDNISLLLLPPYSPELNPVERLWNWLKSRVLANCVHQSLEDLVERTCELWQREVGPALLKTLCAASWAMRED